MLNISGADMDIDFQTKVFGDSNCPWSKDDGVSHKCAIKGTSICKYFNGVQRLDTVMCSYDEENKK